MTPEPTLAATRASTFRGGALPAVHLENQAPRTPSLAPGAHECSRPQRRGFLRSKQTLPTSTVCPRSTMMDFTAAIEPLGRSQVSVHDSFTPGTAGVGGANVTAPLVQSSTGAPGICA